MSDHLSPSSLDALIDGELNAQQFAGAKKHLAGCPACTSHALSRSLLKSATAKAGQRYAPPPHLQQRLGRIAAQANARLDDSGGRTTQIPSSRSVWRSGLLGWAAAAALLLIAVSIGLTQRDAQQPQVASTGHTALLAEVFDQHVAALAANAPPQVLSSDRHTVKPWFQGKLPFSFNLPENLPPDTGLDGANLTYLQNQPVAQLLFHIGPHRVSIFFRERAGAQETDGLRTEHSGFHVRAFRTDDLDGVAISDVDSGRLSSLIRAMEQAQTPLPSKP